MGSSSANPLYLPRCVMCLIPSRTTLSQPRGEFASAFCSSIVGSCFSFHAKSSVRSFTRSHRDSCIVCLLFRLIGRPPPPKLCIQRGLAARPAHSQLTCRLQTSFLSPPALTEYSLQVGGGASTLTSFVGDSHACSHLRLTASVQWSPFIRGACVPVDARNHG